MSGARKLGISGRIARTFQNSQITPLLALVGLLMGLFAVMVTPKEEEPQIDVTFANVFIAYPGASPTEVEHLISTPAEQVLDEIKGVKHVYSISRPGMAVLTVQFKVGEPRNEAIVRLYNKIYSNMDWLPQNLGVGQPIIKPKGIDDVPIMGLTLWSKNPDVGSSDLLRVAHSLEVELKRVKGTRDVYTIGGPDQVVHVQLDPARLAGYGLGFGELSRALQESNVAGPDTKMVTDNTYIPVQAGDFLSSVEQVKSLVVGVHNGKPIYLSDVADVRYGADTPEKSVFIGFGKASEQRSALEPAVTLAIAKKSGANAVDITDAIENRMAELKGVTIPEGVNYTITRDYGKTASDKANKLIAKLIFATSAVVVLVLLTLGWREAVIVGSAVIITLLITLFASWAWGFTINRVSLFALIFSIGILVDDAIVVVENIHRHMAMGDRTLLKAIPDAVDEVGQPTILATFTVIAALMPMAFVSGLMGPYMSPIPINASTGMVISLAVAFVVTPWFAFKLLRRSHAHRIAGDSEGEEPWLLRFFRRVMTPFLGTERRPRVWRWAMLGGVVVLIGAAVLLPVFKLVVLKMLPFDNKSEFQVVVDMPEGTPMEQTQRVLDDLGAYLKTVPEVKDYETYAGTAAPINFNGLVRQYYLRSDANQGDVQVNLVDKHQRDRQSHEIALSVRKPLQEIGARYNANVKIVEVPPGPPVQAPLVAEVYGPDYASQIKTAAQVRKEFEKTPDIVDIDDSVEAPARKYLLRIDRQRAALLGVSPRTVVAAVDAALGGDDASYLHDTHMKYPVPIRLEFKEGDKSSLDSILRLHVRNQKGQLIALSQVVHVVDTQWEKTIYHKDLLPVVFVTGDMAGKLDSPLYGMFEMVFDMADNGLPGGGKVGQEFIQQPELATSPSIKWDGEWQITYETFRDMGIAYAVGMILIYLLVVAQFRSYLVPLIIMAPIPLTVIGVMPGHALLGAQFTATSMIGMIALAGIIVRNSILLVDFINEELKWGRSFDEAVIRAAAVRAKPIVLTGLAAMIGAFFILDDPIFQGLAISLIFGIFASTVLTLLVIPVMYYALMRKRLKFEPESDVEEE